MSRHRHHSPPEDRDSNAQSERSRPGGYDASVMLRGASLLRADIIHSLCAAIVVGLVCGDHALGQQDSSTPNFDRQDVVDLVSASPIEPDGHDISSRNAKESRLPADTQRVDRRPRLFRAKLVSNLILVPNVIDQPYQDAPTETARVAPASEFTTDLHTRNATPDQLRAIPHTDVSAHFEHLTSAPQASETPRQWLDVRPRLLREPSTVVTVDDLPPKKNQLEAVPRISEMIQLYATNLHCADFCVSATYCHQPLYFEDRLLERHGISHGIFRCVPPVQSGLHFLSRTALLPASVLHHRPCSCVRSECICR